MKSLIAGIALAVTVFSVIPAVQSNAADVESRYICGDGVRLRKEGGAGGTVLELMYYGDKINFYPLI